MRVCTFFGHRNSPQSIKGSLREAVIAVIGDGADLFYVGDQGNFDRMVQGVLKELKEYYPIRWYVVLSKFPKDPPVWRETILPEGIETVPPRFAIWHRNKWMVEQSEYVITYTTHDFGGAAQFKEMAQRKKKVVIEIAEK